MQQRRAGNVLEWFDFAVYGYFSTAITAPFFPDSNPAAGQLKTFVLDALGFFRAPHRQHRARPGRGSHRPPRAADALVASWLIGTYADAMLPAYYIMLYGVIGLALMWPMQETNTRSLDD